MRLDATPTMEPTLPTDDSIASPASVGEEQSQNSPGSRERGWSMTVWKGLLWSEWFAHSKMLLVFFLLVLLLLFPFLCCCLLALS